MTAVNIVRFIKDKFNPQRPMGRQNFFWSSVVCAIVIFPILLLLPNTEMIALPVRTALMIEVVNAPLILLQLRRAKAVKIPTFLIFIGWFLDFFNQVSFESPLEDWIFGFNAGLIVTLLFLKNKVEPVSP